MWSNGWIIKWSYKYGWDRDDGSYGGGWDGGESDGSRHDPSVGYDSSIGSGGDGGESGGVDHMDQDMIQVKEDMDQEMGQWDPYSYDIMVHHTWRSI